jgi:hypothetical protein
LFFALPTVSAYKFSIIGWSSSLWCEYHAFPAKNTKFWFISVKCTLISLICFFSTRHLVYLPIIFLIDIFAIAPKVILY